MKGGGEDFHFCEKARAAGFDINVDLNVQCGHYTDHVFTARDTFIDTWRIGQPDEVDLDAPVLVELGPDGERRRFSNGVVKGD
jgi:hypothetical protein